MFNLLAGIAPTIAKAISGDIGGAVQEGLKAFGIKSTGDNAKDKKAFHSAIKTATPEQLASLKKIEADYNEKMKALDIDLEKILADDRASARNMRIETGSKVSDFIGISIVVGFFGVLGLLFLTPEVQNRALDIMLGSLGTMTVAVVSLYYGSSSSSTKKNDMIAKMKY